MAYFRRMKTSTLFRFLVAPTLILCAILRKPIFQWIAVAAVGIWLFVMIVQMVGTLPKRAKRNHKPVQTIPQDLDQGQERTDDAELKTAPEDNGSSLFVLRQVTTESQNSSKSPIPW